MFSGERAAASLRGPVVNRCVSGQGGRSGGAGGPWRADQSQGRLSAVQRVHRLQRGAGAHALRTARAVRLQELVRRFGRRLSAAVTIISGYFRIFQDYDQNQRPVRPSSAGGQGRRLNAFRMRTSLLIEWVMYCLLSRQSPVEALRHFSSPSFTASPPLTTLPPHRTSSSPHTDVREPSRHALQPVCRCAGTWYFTIFPVSLRGIVTVESWN